MYDSQMSIDTPREYQLEELYQLFQQYGSFSERFELVNKGIIKHIRFPGKKKTVIQVYPAGSKVIINVTKESFLKDLALSVVTDGWSDALSDGPMANAPLVGQISAEITRLTAAGGVAPAAPAAPPPAPAPAAPMAPEAPAATAPPPAPAAPAPAPAAAVSGAVTETMLWSGFKRSTNLKALPDRLVVTNKKGKVSEYLYSQIGALKVDKAFLELSMKHGEDVTLLFDTEEECAQWAEHVRQQMG